MAKSEKATVELRVGEILRLLLAGGEFEDIRQYAAAQGWKLSVRQLRRYQERAYRRLANMAHRDQKQLLGRHLMQRRALYARAMKVSDVKTALNVLKDEAQLQGLYSAVRNGESTATTGNPLLTGPPPISREQRFLRTLAAENGGDKEDLRLMEHLTPRCVYRMSDLMMPRMLLNVIALTYAAEQLDHASMVFMSLWRVQANDDEDGTWDLIGGCHAYRFKVEVDAWDLLANELGVDGQKLLRDNHRGTLLELFTDQIYEIALEREDFVVHFVKHGGDPAKLPTAESSAKEWRTLLRQVLTE
jgi:hypothetical protein